MRIRGENNSLLQWKKISSPQPFEFVQYIRIVLFAAERDNINKTLVSEMTMNSNLKEKENENGSERGMRMKRIKSNVIKNNKMIQFVTQPVR